MRRHVSRSRSGRRVGRALALVGIVLMLCSCGGSRPERDPDLDGAWALEGGVHQGRAVPIVDGSRITLAIAGAQVSGRAACNDYGGEIAQEGDSVRIGELTMTSLACAEPVMVSEASYVDALAPVTTATREGDRLALRGPGVELEFGLLPPVPVAELVGTVWTLASLNTGDTVSSAAGTPATLVLRDDGTLSGSSGCRSFSGTYVILGDEVRVTSLTAGSETCPEALAAQDGLVLNVIGDGFTATVDGNRLTLSAGTSGLGYLETVDGG